MRDEGHHVIPKQRIEIARGQVAVKVKLGYPLTDAERRLLETSLTEILRDRRNIVRLRRRLHHRAHHGPRPYRIRLADLPAGIGDFTADYALGWALDHELRLLGITAESLP